MLRLLRTATVAIVMAGGTPTSALTIIGTTPAPPRNTTSFSRVLPFYRTGTLNVEVEVRGGNATLRDGYVSSNYITYYDFFDPETGEPQGGNDTDNEEFYYFEDILDPGSGTWKTSFHVQRLISYVDQRPGEPFPYETGYTVTEAKVFGEFSADAPITYIIRLSGSAMVPEPATWAMLIAGFGLVGAAARRRRRYAAA